MAIGLLLVNTHNHKVRFHPDFYQRYRIEEPPSAGVDLWATGLSAALKFVRAQVAPLARQIAIPHLTALMNLYGAEYKVFIARGTSKVRFFAAQLVCASKKHTPDTLVIRTRASRRCQGT